MTRRRSFCGNEYSKWGEVDPDVDSRACDMKLEQQPDVEAGGRWAMSVYQLPDPTADDDDGLLELNSGGTGTGDTTDGGDLGPVATGERAFTVVNECSSTIRVGSTGGR